MLKIFHDKRWSLGELCYCELEIVGFIVIVIVIIIIIIIIFYYFFNPRKNEGKKKFRNRKC